MKQITLERIHSEWDVDTVIDPIHLDQSSIILGKLHSKYLTYFTRISSQLKKSENQLKKLSHKKRLYYSSKMSKDEIEDNGWKYDPFNGAIKPTLKSEVDKWIEADTDIHTLSETVDEMKTAKAVLTEILSQINFRPNNIKNIIEHRKFVHGD